jgi:two-component system chemotaxis response regulator CheB
MEVDRRFSLDFSEKINFSGPDIEGTFESLAQVFPIKMYGFLLSGSNNDRVNGPKAIKSFRRPVLDTGSCNRRDRLMPGQAMKEVGGKC